MDSRCGRNDTGQRIVANVAICWLLLQAAQQNFQQADTLTRDTEPMSSEHARCIICGVEANALFLTSSGWACRNHWRLEQMDRRLDIRGPTVKLTPAHAGLDDPPHLN